MKTETIDFGDGRELYIIDDSVIINTRLEIYHMCSQLPYRIGNTSRQDVQDLPDRRLKCNLTVNNPIIDYLLQEGTESHAAITKFIPNEKYVYVRSYVNLGTHSDICNIHTDKCEDSRTVLYYANIDWKSNMGGHTIFFDDNGNMKYSVEIKPGRLCIFDGRIPHTVMPMNVRTSPSYRFTVAFKFELVTSHEIKQPNYLHSVGGGAVGSINNEGINVVVSKEDNND